MHCLILKLCAIWTFPLLIILSRTAPIYALPAHQQHPPNSAQPLASLARPASLFKQNGIQKRENFIPTIKQAAYGWVAPAQGHIQYIEFATTQERLDEKKADGRIALSDLLSQGQQGQIFSAEIEDWDGKKTFSGVAKIGQGSSEVKAALLQDSIRSAHIPYLEGVFWIPRGTTGNSLVVMERLGRSLYEVLQATAKGKSTGVQLYIPILHALRALRDAHAAQVAHLDVKMHHILVLEFDRFELEPQWMLVDWGLALNVALLEKDMAEGQGRLPWAKGTEENMAPEIANGPYYEEGPGTNLLLSDIYSLAMTHFDTLVPGLSHRDRLRLSEDLVEDEDDARRRQLRSKKPLTGLPREDILKKLQQNVPPHLLNDVKEDLVLISKCLVSQNQGRLTTYEYYKGLCESKNAGCDDLDDARWVMAVSQEKKGRS
ncbi:hypothetical protein N7492_001201 [Penicillium capsulatum]|uniref:Protein kinase domain-containing protein n=1 Tax=Penicillium capsulatum TaxID=69766 RepID=A0A9W9IV47_9EURO|nr:hypothetical protein N7492_001201 [Penicillium capsulatum]KAJ6129741.1 hypothetical protein N7512_002521 [Penicillium capsulatum]